MDFHCPLVKVGDGLVDGELDAKLSTVLVDFPFDFVAWIVALQLVGLIERHFLIPFFVEKVMGQFLVNWCHFW